MTFEESLQDVTVRVQQLEAHILRSSEYLREANRELKRQVCILYLAIALLLVIQVLFTLRFADDIPFSFTSLTTATSLLAIIICYLLIKTKTWLRRLNEAWLKPEEKIALEALKSQRYAILTRLPRNRDTRSENVEFN